MNKFICIEDLMHNPNKLKMDETLFQETGDPSLAYVPDMLSLLDDMVVLD